MDKNPPLTATDRCDRCGAAAQARTMHHTEAAPGVHVRKIQEGMRPLLWCAHCFRSNREPLSPHLVYMTPLVAKDKVAVL